MSAVQLQDLSPTHEAIIDWLLTNPEKNLSECSKHFGYTQAWLSTVIHSDAFQLYYRRRRAALDSLVNDRICSKLQDVSDKALDKLRDYLDRPQEDLDMRLVNDLADKTLERQGFGVSRGGNTTNNNSLFLFNAPKELLEQARNAIRGNGNAELPAPVAAIEHKSD